MMKRLIWGFVAVPLMGFIARQVRDRMTGRHQQERARTAATPNVHMPDGPLTNG